MWATKDGYTATAQALLQLEAKVNLRDKVSEVCLISTIYSTYSMVLLDEFSLITIVATW